MFGLTLLTSRTAVRLLVTTLVMAAAPVFGQASAADPSVGSGSTGPEIQAALLEEIRFPDLDIAATVRVEGVRLVQGPAEIHLEKGHLVPGGPIDGAPREWAFVGEGRFHLDPPDPIEAGQLELFTGKPVVDVAFEAAVLVVGDPRVLPLSVTASEVADPDTEDVSTLWNDYREAPPRDTLNVEAALLRAARGESDSLDFFAAWIAKPEWGDDFWFSIDPRAREQLTLGRFEATQLDRGELRAIRRVIRREQRQGRLTGFALDDLGTWETWISTSLAGPSGAPQPGPEGARVTHYDLDLKISPKTLTVSGSATLVLLGGDVPSPVVDLVLDPDLEITSAYLADEPLATYRQHGRLLLFLPEPLEPGDRTTVLVHYRGTPIIEDGLSLTMRSATTWYPQSERAAASYEVTFRWPKKMELVAPGRRGGEEIEDGLRRRTHFLDGPATSFSFEVGYLRLVETTSEEGVPVELWWDRETANLISREERQSLLDTLADAVDYYASVFGPYPWDRLAAVLTTRGFSQGTTGLVTLSAGAVEIDWFPGVTDRRLLVAHEVAHQWWGDLVGWESYRDQWISEAMANYSAFLFARNHLEMRGLRPTELWQETLLRRRRDGRRVEALGPVVLGIRLLGNHSSSVYQAIVYKKGAVILDMLARSFGEEEFATILGGVVERAAYKPISTEKFFTLVEEIAQTDLTLFVDGFVRGTGCPDVFYRYHFEPGEEGGWTVSGEARQRTPYRHVERIVRREDGSDDLVRSFEPEGDGPFVLVVPVQISLVDPAVDDDSEVGRVAELHGVLRGEVTRFSFPLPEEPQRLWLDAAGFVFGRFVDATRRPKEALLQEGRHELAAGHSEEGEKLLLAALEAPVSTAPDEDVDEGTGPRLDAAIHQTLARIQLDRSATASARESLQAVKTLRSRSERRQNEELAVLEARLALQSGNPQSAFETLDRFVRPDGKEPEAATWALRALAAQDLGLEDVATEALRQARDLGVDLGPLENLAAR